VPLLPQLHAEYDAYAFKEGEDTTIDEFEKTALAFEREWFGSEARANKVGRAVAARRWAGRALTSLSWAFYDAPVSDAAGAGARAGAVSTTPRNKAESCSWGWV
jgi:hypothetical protein